MPRDYKEEYKYHSTEKQKKNRAARNKARKAAEKAGKVKKGDGKDVGHKKPLKSGGSKALSNTKVQSRSSNRSEGGKIGSKTKKAAGGRKSKPPKKK